MMIEEMGYLIDIIDISDDAFKMIGFWRRLATLYHVNFSFTASRPQEID